MRRRNRSRGDPGREPGAFIALPCAVVDSAAYRGLSHPSRSLLIEVARQVMQDNNGRALLTNNYLRPRGWTSPKVIIKAKRELLDAELIFETCKGYRPNKASWYAITWRNLDRDPGFDQGVERAFVRGRYRLNGASVISREDIGKAPIATPRDIAKPPAISRGDIIQPLSDPSPMSPRVLHLELPVSGAPSAAWVDLDRWHSEGGRAPRADEC